MRAGTDYAAYQGWLVHDAVLGNSRPPIAAVRLGNALLDARIVDAWAQSCPPSLRFNETLPSFLGVATAVNARLARDPASEVWTRIAQSSCMKTVSPAGREWLDLFAAVARRDPDAMARYGRSVLESSRGMRNGLTEYAFLATVAAEVCRGKREEAEKLFAEGPSAWINPDQHSAELRYLYTISHQPLPKVPAAGRCVTALAS
jgi:hypothetical protein